MTTGTLVRARTHTQHPPIRSGRDRTASFCQNRGKSPMRLSSLRAFMLMLVFQTSSPPGIGVPVVESARVFTLINDCKTTIWPAVTPGDTFNGGGFELKSGQSVIFNAPVGWSGRIWARTGCNFDGNGNGSCQTGGCGTTLKCRSSGQTPATLAEFTLASPDFYDVSLVDGFNLPIVVTPVNGRGNCSRAGCDDDMRPDCPKELAKKVGKEVVACQSACKVFDTDEYCCRGVYGNPLTCQPTYYSKKFKQACPAAYSYAYDDPSSIFTCTSADYIVTFCSNRKQTVCTYHDHKLICSGGGSSSSLLPHSFFLGLMLSCLSAAWWFMPN